MSEWLPQQSFRLNLYWLGKSGWAESALSPAAAPRCSVAQVIPRRCAAPRETDLELLAAPTLKTRDVYIIYQASLIHRAAYVFYLFPIRAKERRTGGPFLRPLMVEVAVMIVSESRRLSCSWLYGSALDDDERVDESRRSAGQSARVRWEGRRLRSAPKKTLATQSPNACPLHHLTMASHNASKT